MSLPEWKYLGNAAYEEAGLTSSGVPFAGLLEAARTSVRPRKPLYRVHSKIRSTDREIFILDTRDGTLYRIDGVMGMGERLSKLCSLTFESVAEAKAFAKS